MIGEGVRLDEMVSLFKIFYLPKVFNLLSTGIESFQNKFMMCS